MWDGGYHFWAKTLVDFEVDRFGNRCYRGGGIWFLWPYAKEAVGPLRFLWHQNMREAEAGRFDACACRLEINKPRFIHMGFAGISRFWRGTPPY